MRGSPEADRAASLPLSLRHRQHGAAKDISHEGREIEADHQRAAGHRLDHDARIGQCVVHREKQDEQRHAARDVEIGFGHDAQHQSAEELRRRRSRAPAAVATIAASTGELQRDPDAAAQQGKAGDEQVDIDRLLTARSAGAARRRRIRPEKTPVMTM